MKIELVCCLVLCAVAVHCIPCTTNTDCANSNSVTCAATWIHICEHPHPESGTNTNGGLCTCSPKTCTVLADCLSIDCPSNERRHHCYDGHCVCTRW